MTTMLLRLFALMLLVIPSTGNGVFAFAAKKGGGAKKKKRAGSATNNKGFGAPPPTLEETLSKFRTRIPNDSDIKDCPCGSGHLYKDCCGPFHNGQKPCLTMTDVLRSRYSAFSWRMIRYVMDTTHDTCRDYREDQIAWAKDLNKQGMFDSYEFVGLEPGQEIISNSNENEGSIEFKVTLRAKKADSTTGSGFDEIAGKETVVIENSRFRRNPDDGTWSYASGDVRSTESGLEDTILNS